MPDETLVTQSGSQPFADAVEARDGGRSWLMAGVVITLQPPRSEGLVISDQSRQVAIWQAMSPEGPWTRAQMSPVPGRDGPNETIMYLSRNGLTSVAFGSRASPTEGYPRPSAWTESSSGWTEQPSTGTEGRPHGSR